MRTGTIAFLLGILAVQYLPQLPLTGWCALLVAPIILTCLRPAFYRFLLPLAALGCGFCWACLVGQSQLDNRLPAELEGKELRITGRVSDIPVAGQRVSRFVFVAHEYVYDGIEHAADWKLRLKWYGQHRPSLHAGQQWTLMVKLKRPHSFANPGGFDYERWLFTNRFAATGYVRQPTKAMLIQDTSGFSVDGLRQSIADVIEKRLETHPGMGIVRALAIGDRTRMDTADWQLLTRTGTNHLVAISGLHIGLVSGFFYWLVISVIRRIPTLCRLRPAQDYAALAAILAAVAYAALAGFSIPTQRAVIMVSTFMLAALLRRRIASYDTLCLAMLLVLLHDPLAVLAPGFWLSFSAVLVIIAGTRGQLLRPGWLKEWGRVQWVISIALLPLLILLFGRISLVAPLANMLAIPWVSFVCVPLVMIAMLLSVTGLDAMWSLAAISVQGLSFVLNSIATWSHSSLSIPASPSWTLLPAAAGTALFLSPRGLPGRWLGLLGILPMLLVRQPAPAAGEVVVDILDVGQGLAVVARTRTRILVYDTGPAYGTGFDAGTAVLLPYLQYLGVKQVDMLMISHADRDHNGGTAAVLGAMSVSRVVSGQPAEVSMHAQQCKAGQNWEWDGVRFEVLSPMENNMLHLSDNDHSCVLKIVTEHGSLLIPGDIEAGIEKALLAQNAGALSADILIAPHHGSRSSSSSDFIAAVNPSYVIFSAGYRNRYHLPDAQVVRRYGSIPGYVTARTGRLQFQLSAEGVAHRAWRDRHRRYWHAD